MRIYKCNKNQRGRRDSDLIGNLGTKYSLGFRESINSGADLNNYTTLGSYASKSNSNIIKNSPASAFSLDVEYSLGGGGDYIRQTLKPYSYEGKYYVRYRGYTGVWSEWLSFVLSSDLGYIHCIVEVTANNALKIQDSPTAMNYIPVVVSHSANNNCIDHVFYDNPGGWMIYSTHTQRVGIRFYKYPV